MKVSPVVYYLLPHERAPASVYQVVIGLVFPTALPSQVVIAAGLSLCIALPSGDSDSGWVVEPDIVLVC